MFIPSCTQFPKNFYARPPGRFNVPFHARITPIQNRQFSRKTSVVAPEILTLLQKELDSRVIGQSHATKAIVDALHLHAAELGDPRLPIANLLFLGPTGVGKTELAKVLAEIIYGRREALLQFDMSKYQHRVNVSALVGTTQGFVGYDDGGLLTQPVLQDPDRIILCDELEKADPSIYKVLLSVMGSGEIADNRGRIALFNRSIIISTSNLCSSKIMDLFSQNFSPQEIEEKLRPDFMEHFSPEFYGRVSPIIFKPANKTHLKQVIEKMLKEVIKRIDAKTGVLLTISDNVKQYIEKEGFSPELGFRPTARLIEQKIVLPVAKLINEQQVKEGQTINVSYEGGELYFSLAFEILADPSSNLSQIRAIKNLIAKKNLSEAFRLLENLYSQSFAQMTLWPEEFVNISLQVGKMCLEEKDVPYRITQALRIFTALAAKGNVEAKAYLGRMYFFGQGVQCNNNEALRLFTEASAFDNPIAHYYLGRMYLLGIGGLDYNPLLAEQHFDKAVAKGPAEIINYVGVIYDQSDRMWIEKKKVLNCYKRAAELGCAWAYHNLGLMYLQGNVEEDNCRAKAIDCLLTAGNLGVKTAFVKLGEIYRNGNPKDIELAQRYEVLGGKIPEPIVEEKTPPVPPKPPESPKPEPKKTFGSILKTILWGQNA